MPDIPELGEQALNKAAEIGLSSQLDAVESLEVNIKTEPLQLVQGEVEQVTIEGEGLVMKKDLRLQAMEMQINGVAINPLSITFGKIELTKPTSGIVRVILTEADINHAFNSEYIQAKLRNQKIKYNGQQITVTAQQIDFRLPGAEKIALKASIFLAETGETQQIAFSALPRINPDGKTVDLEKIEYGKDKATSPELTKSLLDETSKILNLNNFDLPGITLRINNLEVEIGQITIQAEADVEQIPTK